MPLLSFLRSKKSQFPQHFLCIDIGAFAVKCLAVELLSADILDESAGLRIVGVGKQPLAPLAVSSGMIMESDMVLEALGFAVKKATFELDASVKDAVFGVGGNLCVGFTTLAKIGRSHPGVFAKKEVEEAQAHVLSAARSKAQMEYLQTRGTPDVELSLLTASVAGVLVDGKKVTDILDLEGTELKLSVFTSFFPKREEQKLAKLAKKLDLKMLPVACKLHAFSSMLATTSLEHLNYVLVDMHGACTDIGVVFDGNIIATKSLPLGVLHFAEELSHRLGLTFVDATKLLSRYTAGELPENKSLEIQDALADVLELWLSGLELAFSEFSGVKTFAGTVYAVGEGFDIPNVYSAFSTEPWVKTIPFKSLPDFVKLSLADFGVISDSTGKASGMEMLVPAVLSFSFLEYKNLI